MGHASELRFDPGALTAAQCQGDACVVCHKKWPRPRARVGLLPDGRRVLACDECAPVLPRPRPEPAPAGRPRTRRPARAAMPVLD